MPARIPLIHGGQVPLRQTGDYTARTPRLSAGDTGLGDAIGAVGKLAGAIGPKLAAMKKPDTPADMDAGGVSAQDVTALLEGESIMTAGAEKVSQFQKDNPDPELWQGGLDDVRKSVQEQMTVLNPRLSPQGQKSLQSAYEAFEGRHIQTVGTQVQERRQQMAEQAVLGRTQQAVKTGDKPGFFAALRLGIGAKVLPQEKAAQVEAEGLQQFREAEMKATGEKLTGFYKRGDFQGGRDLVKQMHAQRQLDETQSGQLLGQVDYQEGRYTLGREMLKDPLTFREQTAKADARFKKLTGHDQQEMLKMARSEIRTRGLKEVQDARSAIDRADVTAVSRTKGVTEMTPQDLGGGELKHTELELQEAVRHYGRVKQGSATFARPALYQWADSAVRGYDPAQDPEGTGKQQWQTWIGLSFEPQDQQRLLSALDEQAGTPQPLRAEAYSLINERLFGSTEWADFWSRDGQGSSSLETEGSGISAMRRPPPDSPAGLAREAGLVKADFERAFANGEVKDRRSMLDLTDKLLARHHARPGGGKARVSTSPDAAGGAATVEGAAPTPASVPVVSDVARSAAWAGQRALYDRPASSGKELSWIRDDPGQAPFEGRIQQLREEVIREAEELSRQYPEGVPLMVQQALQQRTQNKQQALYGEMMLTRHTKQAAGAKLYEQVKDISPLRDQKIDHDTHIEISDKGAALGLSKDDVRYWLDYYRRADFERPLRQEEKAEGVMGTVEGWLAPVSKGIAKLTGTEAPPDSSRLLPDGTLLIHGALHGDREAYEKAVNSSGAPRTVRQAAMAQFPALQHQWASRMVSVLAGEHSIPGLPSFMPWREERIVQSQEGRGADGFTHMTPEQQVVVFMDEMKNRGGAAKYTDTLLRSYIAAGGGVGAGMLGAVGLVAPTGVLGPGSQEIGKMTSELAADWSRSNQKITQGLESKGGLDTFGLRLGSQLSALVPQVGSLFLGGSVLKLGSKGIAALGGVQAAGQQYADTYAQRIDMGDTHEQAWLQTAPAAVATGLFTTALGIVGKGTGPEALAAVARTKAGKEALRSAWQEQWPVLAKTLGFTKHAVGEVIEEVPDELFNQISSALAVDPNADVGQVVTTFITQLPELAAATGIMGGAGSLNGKESSGGPSQPPALPPSPLPPVTELQGNLVPPLPSAAPSGQASNTGTGLPVIPPQTADVTPASVPVTAEAAGASPAHPPGSFIPAQEVHHPGEEAPRRTVAEAPPGSQMVYDQKGQMIGAITPAATLPATRTAPPGPVTTSSSVNPAPGPSEGQTQTRSGPGGLKTPPTTPVSQIQPPGQGTPVLSPETRQKLEATPPVSVTTARPGKQAPLGNLPASVRHPQLGAVKLPPVHPDAGTPVSPVQGRTHSQTGGGSHEVGLPSVQRPGQTGIRPTGASSTASAGRDANGNSRAPVSSAVRGFSTDPQVQALQPHLPALISQATVIDTRQNTDGSTTHTLAHPVEVDGEKRTVTFDVRQDADGGLALAPGGTKVADNGRDGFKKSSDAHVSEPSQTPEASPFTPAENHPRTADEAMETLAPLKEKYAFLQKQKEDLLKDRETFTNRFKPQIPPRSQSQGTGIPSRPSLPAAITPLTAVEKAEIEKINQQIAEIETIQQQHMEAARNLLSVPESERGNLRLTDAAGMSQVEAEGQFSAADRQALNAGAELARRYTHPDLLPAEINLARTLKVRPAYLAEDNLMLFPLDTVNPSSVLHEITHATELESHSASGTAGHGLIKKAHDFLIHRSAGQPAVPLNTLVTPAFQTYEPHEIAYEDEWVSKGGKVYTGKVYPDGGTEIFTTGIERLHADPLEFMQNDPEFFAFVLTHLRYL